MRLILPTPRSVVNRRPASGSTSNPYSRGQVYANAGYGSFPDYDHTFRTYYDNTFTPAAVPVPGALLLGTLGAGIVGYWCRRKSL